MPNYPLFSTPHRIQDCILELKAQYRRDSTSMTSTPIPPFYVQKIVFSKQLGNYLTQYFDLKDVEETDFKILEKTVQSEKTVLIPCKVDTSQFPQVESNVNIEDTVIFGQIKLWLEVLNIINN
jgi:hypothetical protein